MRKLNYGIVAGLAGIACAGQVSGQSLEWKELTPTGAHPFESIYVVQAGAADGRIIVTGNGKTGSGGALFLSEDAGTTWESLSGGLPTFGKSPMVFVELENGDHLVALNGFLARIFDGELTQVELPGTGSANFSFGKVFSGAEGNGRIVLGGSRGSYSADPAWWVSTDGGASFTFYEGESLHSDVNIRESIKGMVYADGKFVGVGLPGAVWISTDGETWDSHELPKLKSGSSESDRMLYDIAYVDGSFYAVGDWYSVLKSSDGETWSVVIESTGSGIPLETLVIDRQVWQAGGRNGAQAWSKDGGATWQLGRSGTTNSINPIVGGNGVFYANGYFSPAGGPIDYGTRIQYDWLKSGFPEVVYVDGTWLALHNETYWRGQPAASVLDGATTQDGINWLHPWLGWFQKGGNGWFFHYNLGWCFTEAKGDGAWIYNAGLGWLFVSSGNWPFFYHATSDEWGYYTGNAEWFFNATRQVWQEKSQFGIEPWVVNKEWLYGKTIRMTDRTGSHTLNIIGPDTVQNSFSINGTLLEGNAMSLFADISTPLEGEGRRFGFDFSRVAGNYVGSRVMFTLTFENAEGGTYMLNYTILQGLVPQGESSIPGTFSVE